MKILAILLVSAALFNSVLGLSHEQKGFFQTWIQSLQEVHVVYVAIKKTDST